MVTPWSRSQPTLLSPRRNHSSSTAIERKWTFLVVTRGNRSDRSYRSRSPKRLTVPVPVRSSFGVPCSRIRRRRSSYWVSMGAPSTARGYGWAPTRCAARPHPHHRPVGPRQTSLRGLVGEPARDRGGPAPAVGRAARAPLAVAAAGLDRPGGTAGAAGPRAPGPPAGRRPLPAPGGAGAAVA